MADITDADRVRMELLDRVICPGCKREIQKDDLFIETIDAYHFTNGPKIHCVACWDDEVAGIKRCPDEH